MKGKITNILVRLSYYPRLIIDSLLFMLIKNDYSLLDKFRDQDCLIVGNGPSLNITPLEKINMLSMGMNKINILFDRTTWRPDIIVCVNGLVIRQNLDFYNTTSIPLILPIKALYLGVKRRSNIIFIKISNSIYFQDNIKKKVGIGSTVTFTCMQIAAFAKVKSVNIVGVDHYFKTTKTEQPHQIKIHEGDDLNHFDPNYFKGKLWGLPDLDGSEKAYLLSKNYFDSHNIIAKDFTVDGKLDIFEKGNIEYLLNRKERSSAI